MNLILGRIPADALPATHLLAGSWVFVGEEARFPDGESRFTFAPDPFMSTGNAGHASGADIVQGAVSQAQALAAQYLPALAASLRSPSLPSLPDAYWETLLAPYLLVLCQQIVGYAIRARALVDAWGARPLRVYVLPADTPFAFVDEHDYTFNGVLGHTYVHWLFSTLLEPIWPKAWEKIYQTPTAMPIAAANTVSLGRRMRECARAFAAALSLSLYFPLVKGFSLWQSLRYSFALWRNRERADYSRTLATCAATAPDSVFDALPVDILSIIVRSVPQSLRKLRHPVRIAPAKRTKLRLMGIQAYENAAYRQKLALWRGAGHKCFCIQHGGNYGHVRSSPVVPIVEYGQHAFITWGWTRQGEQQGHFIPLPHAQLQRIRNAHRQASPTLLYVGTEITVFPYRMDSRPAPLEYVAYRTAKREYFAALSTNIRTHAQYRPYFVVPGTLEDAAWLLPQFPEVALSTGPLEAQLLGCRLLVLDHHGTTLLQALAANVPTVLFWDRRAWALCPEAELALDALAAVGVWHPDAASAARHTVCIWDNINTWWHSPAVIDARATWCAAYALTLASCPSAIKAMDAVWIQTLRTL